MNLKGAQGFERSRSTFLLSGVMIAMSFLAMVIPLAMYHVAQVGAAVGRRQSAFLLFGVIAFLSLLGLVTGEQLFLLSGISALVWMPGFLFGMSKRVQGGTAGLVASLLAMVAVPAISLLTVLLPAQVTSFSELVSTFMEDLRVASEAAGSLGQFQQFETLLKGIEGTREYLTFKNLFESSWEARLIWLVGGSGSPWLFALFLITVGNIVLLDVAFEQVERMRAILRFVNLEPEKFRPPFLTAIKALRESLQTAEGPARFEIIGVKTVGAQLVSGAGDASHQKSGKFSPPFLRRFLKSRAQVNEMVFLGQVFALRPVSGLPKEQSSWLLRDFVFPLPAALLSVVLLLTVGYQQKVLGDNGSLLPFQEQVLSLPLALLGFVGFIGCGLLMVQGAVVFLQRLTPLGIFTGLFALLVVGGWVALNPFSLIAVFGAVGLLDHLYDFRNLVRKTNHV